MTIKEQLENLLPHFNDNSITELFLCKTNWANTPEGKLVDTEDVSNDTDVGMLESDFIISYGALECLDWTVVCSEYSGFELGFVTP